MKDWLNKNISTRFPFNEYNYPPTECIILDEKQARLCSKWEHTNYRQAKDWCPQSFISEYQHCKLFVHLMLAVLYPGILFPRLRISKNRSFTLPIANLYTNLFAQWFRHCLYTTNLYSEFSINFKTTNMIENITLPCFVQLIVWECLVAGKQDCNFRDMMTLQWHSCLNE